MAAATADDFEDFGPIDAAFLEQLPPDIRAAIEDAEARHASGTTQLVAHSDIETLVERQRIATLKAG